MLYYSLKFDFYILLLEQAYYRHRKQGEEEDDYCAEGDDYPFHNFHYGGQWGFCTLHVALYKIQGAWRQYNKVVNLTDYGDVGDDVNRAYAI